MTSQPAFELDTDSAANIANRTLFVEQDNLDILRGMNPGCIDLIYLDPPFNSKQEHSAPIGDGKGGQVMASFKDTWTMDDVKAEWLGLIADQYPALSQTIFAAGASASRKTQAYLTMMAVRLLEMRRVLKPDGSIYLHCDPTESHYLKAVMDAIFGDGANNGPGFRNEIVWRRTAGRSDAHQFGRVHDIILFYTKSGEWTWNTQWLSHDPAYVRRTYRNKDARGLWSASDLTAKGVSGGESGRSWRGIDPGDAGNHWRTPTGGMNDYIIEQDIIPGWPHDYPTVHSRLDALDAAGLIYWPKHKDGTTGMPSLKRYLASTKGTAVDDIFADIGRIQHRAKENVNYPTQKPLALLERLVSASSNEGDLVLDPFCGCATACVAAESLNRHWIGIDLSPLAVNLIHQRFFPYQVEGDEYQGPESRFPELRKGDIIVRRDLPQQTVSLAPLPQDIKHQLYGQQEGQCVGCDWHFPYHALTIDHIVPQSHGGLDTAENLQLLCGSCNSRKGNRLTLAQLRVQNRNAGIMQGK